MSSNNKQKSDIDLDSFRHFVDEFKNESDRAAVVLGAAKLDLVLYQIIQAYLIPSATGKDDLLDGDSPLSTFSAKINFTYRIGLIDSNFARSLHLVRKIRNSFAHEVSGCSLTSGSHSDRVKELVHPFKHYTQYAVFKKSIFKDKDGSDIDFRTTLAIMVGRLEVLLLNVEVVNPEVTKTLVAHKWERI